MKLLKIFGIVAGIHVVALILIFANPGCSTTSKRVTPADTVASTPEPMVSVPNLSNDYSSGSSGDYASTQINATDSDSPITNAPLFFNPDAPAVANDGRYSPTRPNTAVAGALKAEPVADVLPVTTYTVVRGDSLWSIAKRNGLSVVELSAANNLRASSTLQLGQKLIIPGKSVSNTPATVAVETKAVETKAASTSSKESITHVVKSGETLGGIARKYQVKMGDVATANNISDPAKIRPGQSLVIPGWSAPVATTTPKPAETKPAPAPVSNSPVTNSPVQPVNNPVIFTPPPMDRPLDEGFVNDPGDAPVIQVEETSGPQTY
jgi:LysM repeat protein|uniref:LysM peptidoglycan-binding domain-containing protein n=1 Tax=Cephaloticoccus sp. TaxID=1985742 RepID=UPI004049390C